MLVTKVSGVFHNQSRSENWEKLDKMFKKEVKQAKANFYRKTVSELKLKNPGQWYSSLKQMTSYDQIKNDQPSVEEISHLSDQLQSEVIAEQFAKIQNEYEPLKKDDICIPPFAIKDVPQFHPAHVWDMLTKIKQTK